MTILNSANDPSLPVLICICRALREWGPTDEETLADLVAPVGIVSDKKKFWDTLKRWTQWGIFTVEEGRYRLTEAIEHDALSTEFREYLRDTVLDRLLDASNAPDLHQVAGADGGQSTTSDFARVASWALLQDPFEFVHWRKDDLTARAAAQFRVTPLFKGEIFGGLQEWSHFAGLGLPTPQGFLLAPTRALRSRLHLWFDATNLAQDMPLETFLDRARQSIPILPGGRVSRLIEGQTADSVPRDGENDIAPSFSLALMQLFHERQILLADRQGDQVKHFTLRRGDRSPWQQYSHIRLTAPTFRLERP